jgi:hypothetical protein
MANLPSACACGCGEYPKKVTSRYVRGHQWRNPEIREKRAAQLRGRKQTPAHIAKCAATRVGVVHSAERRNAVAKGRIDGWTAPYYTVEQRGYETECWVWARALQQTGYGAVRREGKNLRAHRWMYEQHRGPIPAGLHLDHLCCVKPCVNPTHLEPVTKRENERRARERKRLSQQPQ